MSLSSDPSYIRFVDLVRNSSNELRYLFIAEEGAALANPTALTWTELIYVLQVAVPNTTDIHGQALLYGINSVDFTAFDDTIDVEIESSGTTFQWRRNGGSWTTGVAIGPEVALGANGLKVSFLDTTGYTNADRWTWKRTDFPYDSSEPTCLERVPYLSTYSTDIYVSGVSRNVLRIRNNFLTSVGYKRVYGNKAVIFQNHLVVTQFAEGVYDVSDGVVDPFDSAMTPFIVGWSDLNNPDNFWSTDINEADQYPIPATDFPDTRSNGINDCGELGDVLYLYLPDAIYEMRYVGLPLVMQIVKSRFPKIGSRFKNGLVVSPKGHYFIGRNDFYFFDGVSAPRSIGEPVRKKFFSEVVGDGATRRDWLFGYYDIGKEEVVWTYFVSRIGGYYQCRQVIYMERDGLWFFRNVPTIRCQGRLYGFDDRCVYGAYNALYQDRDPDSSYVLGPIEDQVADGGAESFTEPYVVSQVTKYGQSRTVKEGDGQYIDAKLGSADNIEYAYRTGTFVEDVLNGSFVAGRFTWTPATHDGILTNPKVAAKTWQHRLTFKGSQVSGAKLHEWGDIGLSEGAEK